MLNWKKNRSGRNIGRKKPDGQVTFAGHAWKQKKKKVMGLKNAATLEKIHRSCRKNVIHL